MEANKENVRRTRIPLPKEPLPALPKRLLVDNKQKQGNIPARKALGTLNCQICPQAGPSKVSNKPYFFMNLDTKHVTIKQKNEKLDWNYSCFKEVLIDKDASGISISDDEEYLNKENHRHFVQQRKGSDLLSAVTPNLKDSLEPSRVKNIKRSLKRPHSRELQGLTPIDKHDDKVKRRLKFEESFHNSLASPGFWKRSYMRCLDRDYTAEIFKYLLAVEKKPLAVPRTSSITRACVINWLMKINGPDGNPSTIQSACWFLDSILGTGHVQLDKLQLVATSCYWIAQKINGPVTPAARLVKCADGAFTAEKLLSAEKIILSRLKFPPQPVVAQDYITYLSWHCDPDHGGEIEEAATFLCMSGLMVDKLLCEEYPSVIAVAAVRNALLLLGKKNLMIRLQMYPVFEAAEKKTTHLSFICSILRRAVRTVSAPIYEYKTPILHYGSSPNFIAQKIIAAANKFAVLDTRNIDLRN